MPLKDKSAKLALVSAWNDSGGAFLNRLLDGHSAITSWPFELQLGTAGRTDASSTVIFDKYRWPQFPAQASASTLFDLVIDDELKAALGHGDGNKFSAFQLTVTLEQWKNRFAAMLDDTKSRRAIIAAYIDSYFAGCGGDLAEGVWISGHCPSVVVDAGEILADFPDAKIVHIWRGPIEGFADFRRRHPAFDARDYVARWKLVNGAALGAYNRWPQSVLLVRFEDVLADRAAAMRAIAAHLDLPFEVSMLTPSWSGKAMDERAMGPFGGVPAIGRDYEHSAAASVSEQDKAIVLHEAAELLESLSRRRHHRVKY